MRRFPVSFRSMLITTVLPGLLVAAPASAQNPGKRAPVRSALRRPTSDSELARLRAEVVEKMKESRASAEKLLAIHEEQTANLKKTYEERRELYRQGLISRVELAQSERQLAESIVRVDEDKKWLAESDIAVTEATAAVDL